VSIRVATPLSDDVERLIHRTIGCCIEVHRELGPGLVEAAYQRAVSYELAEQGIPFDRERSVAINYRGRPVYTHRLDLVVADEILVELKAVDRLHPLHSAQVLSELKAAGLRVALLVNFNVPVLRDGIKRFVMTAV
jgi:GxxExxY protein